MAERTSSPRGVSLARVARRSSSSVARSTKPRRGEAAQEPARRRQRDADPGCDLADTRAARVVADDQQGAPLGKRELGSRGGFGEGARREPDGPDHHAFEGVDKVRGLHPHSIPDYLPVGYQQPRGRRRVRLPAAAPG